MLPVRLVLVVILVIQVIVETQVSLDLLDGQVQVIRVLMVYQESLDELAGPGGLDQSVILDLRVV